MSWVAEQKAVRMKQAMSHPSPAPARKERARAAKQRATASCAVSIQARLVPRESRRGAQRNLRLQGSPMTPVQNAIALLDIPRLEKITMETHVATAKGSPSAK